MLAISVMFEIHPEFSEKFREAALRHAHNSRTNEEGCLQFTVHVHPEDPNRFFLYEAYRSESDLKDVHNVSSYMAEFREMIGPWIKSRELVIWNGLNPEK